MHIQSFFDTDTATVTHILTDESTKKCAIIDPILNFCLESKKAYTAHAKSIIDFVKLNLLSVEWILETHLHADHLTAAHYLKSEIGGKIGIGSKIKEALNYWIPLLLLDIPVDGSQFDVLFEDGDILKLGNTEIKVIHTPGHTPACVCYLVNDAVFVGDLIFMPYVGTARADFPGGNAYALYHSIQKILALPDETRIFTGHDYPPEGSKPAWQSTVGEQKKTNLLLNETISESEFIYLRTKRDHNKPSPKLMIPSLLANLKAGKITISASS